MEEILNWNLWKKGHCVEEDGNGVYLNSFGLIFYDLSNNSGSSL